MTSHYLAQLIDAYINGLVQDCSISIANAMEILQSCSKPSIYTSLGLQYIHAPYTMWG